MADSRFKHIAVNAAEAEEDVVIKAGVSRDEVVVQNSDINEEAVPRDRASIAVNTQGFDVTQSDQGQRDVCEGQPARADAEPRNDRKAQQGYRPTTLADLESNPMSTTQKIVIIAAVLCIIGAVAYYLAFMG